MFSELQQIAAFAHSCQTKKNSVTGALAPGYAAHFPKPQKAVNGLR